MRINLEPQKDQSEKERKKFAVLDIETMNWTEFLVLGFYDGNIVSNFYNISEFLDFIFDNFSSLDIFAHFGGRFDFLFIIRTILEDGKYKIYDMIPWGSGLLCFSLKKGKKKITFRDSSALLPFGLKKLTESFGVESLKKDWDHSKTKGVTPELLEYLKFDLKGLYEVIDNYYSQKIITRAGYSYTQAGQALRILRNYIRHPILGLSQGVDDSIRAGFFGGRTEIYRPFYRSKKIPLFCYDVNSLYPYVMRENDFPNKFEYATTDYEKNKMGIYYCEVQMPKMYLPPLGARIEGKYIFPCGVYDGVFTSAEIEYAKTMGAKFKIREGFIFENAGKIFEEFINTLYKIRTESKSGVASVIAKLLMNSCYGRFALKTDRENIVFDNGDVGLKPLRELKVGKNIYRLMTKEIDLTAFSNVAVAIFITGYARIHMHKLMMPCRDSLFYTDTDSIYTTCKMPTGTGLGELKLEDDCWDAENKEYSACFLLPKTYKAGSKVVMKGFDKKKIQHFTIEDFFACLEGDMQVLKIKQESKFATLKTALRKGFIVGMTEEGTRQIRSRYDKRIIVRQGNKWDTRPIELGRDNERSTKGRKKETKKAKRGDSEIRGG